MSKIRTRPDQKAFRDFVEAKRNLATRRSQRL
jgi:hypothetical protein